MVEILLIYHTNPYQHIPTIVAMDRSPMDEIPSRQWALDDAISSVSVRSHKAVCTAFGGIQTMSHDEKFVIISECFYIECFYIHSVFECAHRTFMILIHLIPYTYTQSYT